MSCSLGKLWNVRSVFAPHDELVRRSIGQTFDVAAIRRNAIDAMTESVYDYVDEWDGLNRWESNAKMIEDDISSFSKA